MVRTAALSSKIMYSHIPDVEGLVRSGNLGVRKLEKERPSSVAPRRDTFCKQNNSFSIREGLKDAPSFC